MLETKFLCRRIALQAISSVADGNFSIQVYGKLMVEVLLYFSLGTFLYPLVNLHIYM
jgi:hypothetical protein